MSILHRCHVWVAWNQTEIWITAWPLASWINWAVHSKPWSPYL